MHFFFQRHKIAGSGHFHFPSKCLQAKYLFNFLPDMIKAGKWVMSFQWRMRGIELHCDTDIGKHLSSLGQTLTALAGEPDVANIDSVTDLQDRDPSMETAEGGRDEVDSMEGVGDRKISKNIEKNMWDQARKVNELR